MKNQGKFVTIKRAGTGPTGFFSKYDHIRILCREKTHCGCPTLKNNVTVPISLICVYLRDLRLKFLFLLQMKKNFYPLIKMIWLV